MEIILALVVNLVTAGSKRALPVIGQLSTPYLRLIVAILSFAAVLGNAALSGGTVDAGSVDTLVSAINVFAVSQGAFFLSKLKKPDA
jgi:hypothetical protein